MRVSIKEQSAKVAANLGKAQKQIPFAESRAVNALAYSVQRDTIERLLPEHFTLRTDWWKPGRKTGVNYFPSHKRQFPNIIAKVNTLASFMEKQETGGVKTPPPGQNFVAIPTRAAQPDKRVLIRPNRRFRALTGKLRGSRTLTRGGNPWDNRIKPAGRADIAVRLLDKYRLPLAVMYIGKTSVTIKPRFGFRANATAIVERDFQRVFDRELKQAIATAK